MFCDGVFHKERKGREEGRERKEERQGGREREEEEEGNQRL